MQRSDIALLLRDLLARLLQGFRHLVVIEVIASIFSKPFSPPLSKSYRGLAWFKLTLRAANRRLPSMRPVAG
jgi:hypothetical protein